MKILHVISSLRTGGAEHLMVDLLPRLRNLGNEVDICVFSGERTAFYNELENAGIKVIPLSKNGKVYDVRYIPKLRKLMKQYDIVHTHITAPQYFAAIGKPKGVKLITTEHATSNRRRNSVIFKVLDKWMYGRYSKIISISEPCDENLKKYLGPDYPFCVIKNGVDVNRFLNATSVDLHLDGKKVMTMVAGFRYEKDQPTVIRSLKYLPEDYHLVLVGDGEKRPELEALIAELGLTERVHLLGLRTDVPGILKASDFVIMSSHREGLSLSNVEGMASGKPFIASDVEGLREVTKGYGVLFPHGDDKALAEEILKLDADAEYKADVVRRCQEKAIQYDINVMAEKYMDVYKKLVK